MDLEVVATTPDAMLAAIWKGVLETAGIEAVVTGDDLQMAWGSGMSGMKPAVAILVRAEDLDRARAALQEAQTDAT